MVGIRKKDGLPFYEGAEKTRKLQELSDAAVAHHIKATQAWRGALDHAIAVGTALNEAKRILGGRGKWTAWLETHFCKNTGASKETARSYMRVARHKKDDDPQLREAYAKGLTQNSIESVLKILRNSKEKKPTTTLKPSERVIQKDEARDGLRKQFAEMLNTLDYEELMLLEQGFEYYFWPKTYDNLQDTLCKVLEYDYYYEERDTVAERRAKREVKRQARGKVTSATGDNRKRESAVR